MRCASPRKVKKLRYFVYFWIMLFLSNSRYQLATVRFGKYAPHDYTVAGDSFIDLQSQLRSEFSLAQKASQTYTCCATDIHNMNCSVLIPFQMSIYADNLSLEDASSDVYIPTPASLFRLCALWFHSSGRCRSFKN